jgi:hypothetical protein
MNIIAIITNLFTYTAPQYIFSLLAQAVLIAAGFVLVYIWKPRWRNLARCILVVWAIRLILFGQYLSWEAYADHLSVEDLGWRPKRVVSVEHKKFFKTSLRAPYVAVGSSQTLAVYGSYSKEHDEELGLFQIAGMSPLDFWLYRHYIAQKKPQYILLYLSEFDQAKEPRMEWAKFAPSQGLALAGIYPALERTARKGGSELALKEMMVAEIFPEYKYSFIFKGFLDKATKKRKALATPSLREQLDPNPLKLLEHARGLEDDLSDQWIEDNKYFLEKFLVFCRERGFKVLIVEGQYNPLAVTEKTAYLNEFVRQELQELDQTFDHVVFIPRARVMEFGRDDYRDVMHVRPEAGYRFAQQLMNVLKDKEIIFDGGLNRGMRGDRQ